MAIKAGLAYIWWRSRALKTYDFYVKTLERLVSSVYSGNLGGDFRTILEDLVRGQIAQAFEQAWADEGKDGDAPEYMQKAAHALIVEQHGFVERYYRDIVDARVDGTSVEPLLVRAAMWAERWNEAYTAGVLLITKENGGRMVWKEGDTKEKCNTCLSLDGIVAYASEWDELGLHPRDGPNDRLDCEGWNCQCTLEPTDARRSPNAMARLVAASGG